MESRLCLGCRSPLAYGSTRRYHSLACRRMDNTLARLARERGLSPRAYLAAVLTEAGDVLPAAMRLGVDVVTVRRWCRRWGIRRRVVWGEAEVRVIAVDPRPRRQQARRESDRQMRLL